MAASSNPCNYKPWYLGCTVLCGDMEPDTTILPLKKEFCTELCSELGTDCYTYLVLDNGFRTETVRAYCSAGNVILDRAVEGRARSWFSGDNVTFQMTKEAVMDCQACAMQTEIEEETPLIKSDTLQISQNEDGQWCIEASDEASGDCSWTDCGYKYSWANGIVTKEALPATEVLRDGVYSNATIVVEGGCISAITKGCPTLVAGCPEDCGPCEKEDGV